MPEMELGNPSFRKFKLKLEVGPIDCVPFYFEVN